MNGSDAGPDLHAIISAFRLHIKLFLIVFIIIALAFGALAYFLPDIYRATATVLLEQKPIADAYVGASRIAPDIEKRLRIFRTVVESDSLLRKVVARLHLVPNNYDPVMLEEKFMELRDGIDLEIKGTDSLQISYEGKDPHTVMRIANELTNFFIEDMLAFLEKGIQGTKTFLVEELKQTEQELKAQEKDIKTFKAKYQNELPSQLTANQIALDRALRELDANEAELHLVSAKLEMAKQNLRDKQAKKDPIFPDTEEGPSPLEIQEAKLKALQAKYTDNHPDIKLAKLHLEQLRSNLPDPFAQEIQNKETTKGPHKKQSVKATLGSDTSGLRKQIKELEIEKEALLTAKPKIAERVRTIEDRIAKLATREEELIQLTRGYEVLNERYQALMRKKLDAELSIGLERLQREETFQVLDPATLPVIPIGPPRGLILAGGFVVALGMALGSVVIREITNQTLRRPEDLASYANALPLLGTLVHIEPPPAKVKPKRNKNKWAILDTEQNKDSQQNEYQNEVKLDPFLVTHLQSQSQPAEEYRHVRTHIQRHLKNSGHQIILIASGLPNEGKSIVAANLAITMAQAPHQKVLLIDTDFRNPNIHNLFGLSNEEGFIDILENQRPLNDVMHHGPGNLHILTSGVTEKNPADLLTSPAIEKFFQIVRGEYSLILLDSPPALPVTDACILSSFADEVLFVSRAGQTPGKILKDTLDRFTPGKMSGIILNDVDARELKHRNSYEYLQTTNLMTSHKSKLSGPTETSERWS